LFVFCFLGIVVSWSYVISLFLSLSHVVNLCLVAVVPFFLSSAEAAAAAEGNTGREGKTRNGTPKRRKGLSLLILLYEQFHHENNKRKTRLLTTSEKLSAMY